MGAPLQRDSSAQAETNFCTNVAFMFSQVVVNGSTFFEEAMP